MRAYYRMPANAFQQQGSEYDPAIPVTRFMQIIFDGDRSAPLRWLDQPVQLGQDVRFLWSTAGEHQTDPNGST